MNVMEGEMEGNAISVDLHVPRLLQFESELNLNTCPTIVPTPTSVSWATPATDVNNSGADDPAAINVAPATSSDKLSFSEMISRDGTKKSSHNMARAAKKQSDTWSK